MEETSLINPNDLTFAMVVLPPVIAIINQKHWSTEVRALVALAACLVYSLVVTFLRQDLDWTAWRNVILQVMIGAFGAYKLFWQPSNIAPAIEDATTVRRARKAPPPLSPPQAR